MIRIKPATRESRPRDRKRYRAVLSVGDRSVHLSLDELSDLIADAWIAFDVLSRRKAAAALARRKGLGLPPFTWCGERFKGGGQ
jgi:hypothetical protein